MICTIRFGTLAWPRWMNIFFHFSIGSTFIIIIYFHHNIFPPRCFLERRWTISPLKITIIIVIIKTKERNFPTTIYIKFVCFDFTILGIVLNMSSRGEMKAVASRYQGSSTSGHHSQKSTMKPFVCYKCIRSYSSKGSLRRHLVYECGKPPQYICNICKKGFHQKSNFEWHHVNVHGVKYSQLAKIFPMNNLWIFPSLVDKIHTKETKTNT